MKIIFNLKLLDCLNKNAYFKDSDINKCKNPLIQTPFFVFLMSKRQETNYYVAFLSHSIYVTALHRQENGFVLWVLKAENGFRTKRFL